MRSVFEIGLAVDTRRCRPGLKRLSGNKLISRRWPDWIRWMLVDSSGSMKPLDSPRATHVLVPELLAALAGDERSGRGSARASPSRLGHQHPAASSSLRWRLQ
jgi:hypothetical protein